MYSRIYCTIQTKQTKKARQRALVHMDRHMVLLGEEGKILDLLWDLLNNSIIICLLVGTSQLLLPSGHVGFVPVTVVVSS